MVDWTTAQICARGEVPHRGFVNALGEASSHLLFDTGRVQQVAASGMLVNQFSAREVVEGSFSSTLSFRSPYPESLEMSGNPVKFLQGHNLFGSDDYMGLFFEGSIAAAGSGVFFPTPDEFQEWNFSAPRFTRLDITKSYRFASNDAANAWLRYVGRTAHTRHRIKSDAKNGTVYFGKGSSRWSFKIYNKFEEITSGKRGHTLHKRMSEQEFKQVLRGGVYEPSGLSLSDIEELEGWSEGVVRFELTIRAKEMEKYSDKFGQLMFSPRRIWDDYFNKIEFNANGEVWTRLDMEKLPRKLRHAVLLWNDPANDLSTMYAKSTFYRLRRELKEYKIDIAESPVTQEAYTVPLELVSSGWNPEPISRLMYMPDPEILEEYGLGVLDKWMP